MKCSCILVLIIFCILIVDAQPPNILHRCINLFSRAVAGYKVGHDLNPELKDSLHNVKFRHFRTVKNEKDEIYPNCRDYRSVTFHFPPEGDQYAIVEVAGTENRSRQTINVKYQFFYEKAVIGVKKSEFPPITEFGFDSVKKYASKHNSQKVMLYKEKLFAVRCKCSEEMVFAMIYLDESDFKYALFQTLDKECAWIGWRAGTDHALGVPDEIKQFLKVNGIAYLDHNEASGHGS